MTHFSSLHPASRRIALGSSNQAEIEKKFSSLIDSSKLHRWTLGDPIREDNHLRLLICVATWSLPDMQLLDTVNQKLLELESLGKTGIRVDVFSLDSIKDGIQAQQYFPNFSVLVTPLVGLWIWGVHQTTRIGPDLAFETLERV